MRDPSSFRDSLSLEVLGEEDLDHVLALEKSSFLLPWSRESFLGAIRDPKGLNFVCKFGRDVAGYITAFRVLDEVYITNLLVAASFRRRGVATELLEYLMGKVRNEGGKVIFLEVRAGNRSALMFYESMNFRRVGVRKKYYPDTNEDAYVMKFSLD